MLLLLVACTSSIPRSAAPDERAARLYESPAVRLAPRGAGEAFGFNVAAAGDVDGDGFDDVVVSAYSSAAAYVHHGSEVGVDSAARAILSPGGARVDCAAGVGDVDGDGYDDIAIGDGVGADGYGQVTVYYGGSGGIDSTRSTSLLGVEYASGFGGNSGGTGVSGGDVNGDGYADLVVGASSALGGVGAAYLYLGGAGGLDATPVLTLAGPSTGISFGWSVSLAADLNADGLADVAVGAIGNPPSFDGAVYLYPGDAAAGIDDSAPVILTPTTIPAYFGLQVSGSPDVDGDGTDDLLVGAATTTLGEGRVYIYSGDSLGFEAMASMEIVEPGSDWSEFGWSVAAAGDVNGDGLGDVIVGAPAVHSEAGAAYLFHGADGGVETSSSSTLEVGLDDSNHGWSVSSAGDVDGDGFDDVLVGAWKENSKEGAAYVYTGYNVDIDLDGWDESEDCDDDDASVSPGSEETCNGLDDDCDGVVDEAGSTGEATWYPDLDGDTYGDARGAVTGCDRPDGFVADASDCDDADGAVFPTAVEVCNGVDDNCDGQVDERGATGESTWYADEDDDGFGDPDTSTLACAQPDGYTTDATDCDDTSAVISPAALEVCNGVDDDCDGVVDGAEAEGLGAWFPDADGDAYGDPAGEVLACEQPDGFVSDSTDCDDTNAAISPAATEVCNGVDDDCDTLVDEQGASGESRWYFDDDGDGYGDLDVTILACDPPEGYGTDTTDCDDTNPAIFPGADELPDDGVDQNCDGEDLTTGKEDDALIDCGCASTPPIRPLIAPLVALLAWRRRRPRQLNRQ